MTHELPRNASPLCKIYEASSPCLQPMFGRRRRPCHPSVYCFHNLVNLFHKGHEGHVRGACCTHVSSDGLWWPLQ